LFDAAAPQGTYQLTAHHLARPGAAVPPFDDSLLCDYVHAANGLFVRSRKPGLEVCVPVAIYTARGLSDFETYVRWDLPRVPARLVSAMLAVSQGACNAGAREALFHLRFDESGHAAAEPDHISCEGGWHAEMPEQRATDQSVIATGTGLASRERATIELHSHHAMAADFSPDDDADEGRLSFRVYAVVGRIFDRPELRARVAVFGHFHECPASIFFELPEGLRDCVGRGR
jgi:hypothetical protein